jgi:hypothetical protein
MLRKTPKKAIIRFGKRTIPFDLGIRQEEESERGSWQSVFRIGRTTDMLNDGIQKGGRETGGDTRRA